MSTVFDAISCNIDEVLSINPSANVFVFVDFNVDHEDWLTFPCRIDRPGQLFYNFSVSNDLTQMVNFPTRIPDCDSQSGSSGFLDVCVCFRVSFPSLRNSDHVVSVSIDFLSNSKGDGSFYHTAYDYFCTGWDGLHDHLRDVPW